MINIFKVIFINNLKNLIILLCEFLIICLLTIFLFMHLSNFISQLAIASNAPKNTFNNVYSVQLSFNGKENPQYMLEYYDALNETFDNNVYYANYSSDITNDNTFQIDVDKKMYNFLIENKILIGDKTDDLMAIGYTKDAMDSLGLKPGDSDFGNKVSEIIPDKSIFINGNWINTNQVNGIRVVDYAMFTETYTGLAIYSSNENEDVQAKIKAMEQKNKFSINSIVTTSEMLFDNNKLEIIMKINDLKYYIIGLITLIIFSITTNFLYIIEKNRYNFAVLLLNGYKNSLIFIVFFLIFNTTLATCFGVISLFNITFASSLELMIGVSLLNLVFMIAIPVLYKFGRVNQIIDAIKERQ